MINPDTLDLSTLPWLPLEEKSAFPKRPAIYFAIDSLGNVQYIGRSVNVRIRWEQHHKYDALQAIGNVKVAYLFTDTPELLPQIETALIKWFKPQLNVIHNSESFHPTSKLSMSTTGLSGGSEPEHESEVEPITRFHPDAVAVRIFLLESERERLKRACDDADTTMSHLARSLLVRWLLNNERNDRS